MTKETADKKHTITLTDERPVTVKTQYWPVIAKASKDRDHNNQDLFRRYYIRVRQHDTGAGIVGDETTLTAHPDGRCLVYGWHSSSWQGESGSQAGYRCHIDDIVATIRQVGDRIGAPQDMIDDCVADLPATDEPDPENESLPCVLSLEMTVENIDQANGYIVALIEIERGLREENGIDGYMPISPLTKLADTVREARRTLQRITRQEVSEVKL